MLKYRFFIKFCLVVHPVNLTLQLIKLHLQRRPVSWFVDPVIQRLDRELPHSVEHCPNLAHGSISSLYKTNPILCIF